MKAYSGDKPADQSVSLPVVAYDEAKAHNAFTRYSALRKAERDDPSLSDEPGFKRLISAAWEQFSEAFWRLC